MRCRRGGMHDDAARETTGATDTHQSSSFLVRAAACRRLRALGRNGCGNGLICEVEGEHGTRAQQTLLEGLAQRLHVVSCHTFSVAIAQAVAAEAQAQVELCDECQMSLPSE
jgi:hypothetical protein